MTIYNNVHELIKFLRLLNDVQVNDIQVNDIQVENIISNNQIDNMIKNYADQTVHSIVKYAKIYFLRLKLF